MLTRSVTLLSLLALAAATSDLPPTGAPATETAHATAAETKTDTEPKTDAAPKTDATLTTNTEPKTDAAPVAEVTSVPAPDFITGCEDYIVIDDALKTPKDCKPDHEIAKGNFYITFIKKYSDADRNVCVFQVMTVYFKEPNDKREKVFRAKVGCMMGSQEHPLDKVVQVTTDDTIIYRIQGHYCLKTTVVWDDDKKEANIQSMCSYQCKALEDAECPDSAVNNINDISVLFDAGEPQDIWSKDYLQSQMSIRLVSKKWKPIGPSSTTDAKLDVYSWGTKEAFNALRNSPLYDYAESSMKDVETLLSCEDFDKNLPTIMIVHPLSTDANHNFVTATVTALAMRNLHRYNNVIAVDMPGLNLNMLLSVMNTVMMGPPMFEPMAEALGDLFVLGVEKQLMRPEDIHLIGWSYSGQLVGYMGRYIQQKTTKQIGSIVSLDPNANVQNPALVHISSKDAKVVHIYHTNAFPCGTLARLGTADFVFDGGFILPECVVHPAPMFCSHFHVVQRWWYVVLYGKTLFIAKECESILKFNAGVCDSRPQAFLTYPITDNPAKGQYFLRTLPVKPYGMGEQGSVADPKVTQMVSKVVAEHKIDLTLFMMLSVNMAKVDEQGGQNVKGQEVKDKQAKGQVIIDEQVKGKGVKDQEVKDQGVKDQGVKDQEVKDQGVKDQGVKDQQVKQ